MCRQVHNSESVQCLVVHHSSELAVPIAVFGRVRLRGTLLLTHALLLVLTRPLLLLLPPSQLSCSSCVAGTPYGPETSHCPEGSTSNLWEWDDTPCTRYATAGFCIRLVCGAVGRHCLTSLTLVCSHSTECDCVADSLCGYGLCGVRRPTLALCSHPPPCHVCGWHSRTQVV